jgi:hypothetical protein
MLSQPTPPVSLLEAKQLSIIFSQMADSSCFATIPRRTNSITACEDWQSQIPVFCQCVDKDGASGYHTITCNDQELIVLGDVMYLNVRECGDDLVLRRQLRALLEFKVANGTRQGKVAIDSPKVYKASSSLNSCFLG